MDKAQQVDQTLIAVKKTTQETLRTLWNQRSSDQSLACWHGYSVSAEGNAIVASLFSASHSHSERLEETLVENRGLFPLLHELKARGLVSVKHLVFPKFCQLKSGKPMRLDCASQVGNLVYASDDNCGIGHVGTIGAFLRLQPELGGDSPWLLSSAHILVRHLRCLKCNLQIYGADNTVLNISDQVQYGRKCDNTLLDAALAPVDNGYNAYADALGLKYTDPGQLPDSTSPGCEVPVKKQGSASGVTCGLFVKKADKVLVVDPTSGTEKEFSNELIIGSIGKDPFLEPGDSGSLVVDDKGYPVGLLFATAADDDTIHIDLAERGIKLPLALATPFDVVLGSLSQILDPSGRRKLVMLPWLPPMPGGTDRPSVVNEGCAS